MIKLAARRLVLTGLGLLAVPVSVQAQAATGDMFGIPWSGVSSVELMDEADLDHMSASRSADFERLGLQADRHCRDLVLRASMGGDPHERALRSSDLILAHLKAASLNRFRLDRLTFDDFSDITHRNAVMPHLEESSRRAGLDLLMGSMPSMIGPNRVLESKPENLPYDCQ
jgi:hypothetical protein